MKQLGYVGVFLRSFAFPALTREQLKNLQGKRLRKLVKDIKTGSPYFAELYSNIGDNFTLNDLPVTTKTMMMENFDQWLSNTDVKLEHVRDFISDKNNLSRLIAGKYMAATTSGSTGYPAALLFDKTARNVTTVTSMFRITHFRFPMADVVVDDLFLISNGIARHNVAKWPFLKHVVRNINAKLPFEQIVSELNSYQPKIITSYSGTLSLLADEALSGNLKIKPSLILASGEHLSRSARAKLEKTFHCTVHTIYGCTEGGTMAFECRQNHLHINSDWCILEPVNDNFEPVPYGVLSQKVLLTNLANATQPIIRYELTDRVIVHDEPCPCGIKSMWIEVEGRTNDVLFFVNDGRKTGIAPLSLYIVVEPIPGVRHFQIILHGTSRLEVRLSVMDEADPAVVFCDVERQLTKYLASLEINNACIYMSDKQPARDPVSGKFKQIYQVQDTEDAVRPDAYAALPGA